MGTDWRAACDASLPMTTFSKMLAVLVLGAAGCGAAPANVELIDDAAATDDSKADSASSLTAAQAKTVLAQIDSTCGDTWCDGDFDFRFKKIVCQPARNSCTLTTFDLYPAFSDVKPNYYWRSCRLIGLSTYTDLVSTSA